MKRFTEYIFESLSKEQQDNLLSLVDDTNYNDIMSLIKRHLDKGKYSTEKYIDFFDRHGLNVLQWGRNGSATKQFTNLFGENDKLDVLNAIIENDGVVSVFDKKGFKQLPMSGNIYDFCEVKVGNEMVSFKDEAMEIATWLNSGSATAGPGEILLKFILKEGGTGKVGDVLIRHNDHDYMVGDDMEVKASTVSEKNPSGGHAAGQKGGIKKAWSIYWYLEKHLFGNDISKDESYDFQYFQNENKTDKSCNAFIDKIKENQLDNKTVVTKIVEAIAFQYNFIDDNGKDARDGGIPKKDTIISNGLDIISHRITYTTLKNLVGCIQLYFYSIIEEFEYFICMLIAKQFSANHQTKEGKYILFRCNEETNDLLNFKNVLEYLYFGQLDSTKTTQGRTGKIFYKL